jgi:hypothetical protein
VSGSIEESIEYRHMVAQGIPADVAWGAAWIDRAYTYLVTNGMDGADAYGHAVVTWATSCLDFSVMTPEAITRAILEKGYKAKRNFPSLDPQQPEASFVLQHRPDGQGKPS